MVSEINISISWIAHDQETFILHKCIGIFSSFEAWIRAQLQLQINLLSTTIVDQSV